MASMTVTDRMMQRAEELAEWAAAETPLAAQATVTAADVLRYCAWLQLAVLEQARVSSELLGEAINGARRMVSEADMAAEAAAD